MSEAPLNLDELAARLLSAAETEIFSINQIEFVAATPGAAEGCRQMVGEVRRQARALGLAYRIALKLKERPDLALGLDIAALEQGGAA
ncbi:hypothetical protein FG93_01960 [Bosea sp. LC85]|uniref:hypothetical protein n=1 Tax=Bosea sp. LC85 TaxID=1502851 RepID=UPI0004E3050A|nr:hypothetical protein [Bosea sp. LC85]KFC73216.1 hypothetical protein FG93_01960 [Bosea sp. LC85]